MLNAIKPPPDFIRDFIRLESFGGILLFMAAILAMVVANSPLAFLYDALLNTTVAIQIGSLEINKALLLWINDGLMAVFFFLIGLEIKREIVEGELSSISQVILPGIGALGGIIGPALIYIAFNLGDSIAMDGWAIPVATDIAFALALLGSFGARVPTSLKVFLLTLAIFDDLAAIVIIAFFYSGDLSLTALLIALVALCIAVLMNKVLEVTNSSAYILLGVVLWVAVLKSGVHATLAGVLIAFCIPMRDENGDSPVKELEHNLHGPVAYAILPIFAFANAGLSFADMSIADLLHPITAGVMAGLVIGKPLGIILFIGLAVGIGIVKLPKDIGWTQLSGVAFVCGVGFTMSLFIAGLAFEHGGGVNFAGDRLGIILGSITSALLGFLILKFSLPAASSGSSSAAR